MNSIKEMKEVSETRKESVFNIEKQNIKNIIAVIRENESKRENVKGEWITKEYDLSNSIVYELTGIKEEPTILISPKKIKKLSWSDLIQIRENSQVWSTNIEQGIWITSYNDKVRYTIVDNKNIILGVQIEKIEEKIKFSYCTENEEIANQLKSNAQDKILLIDMLKEIEYDNNKIKEMLKELNLNCITINKNEVEKQILIQEKIELQKNVNDLTEQINDITKQVNDISKQADSAEAQVKKTMEEINKVTKENESLKNSIMNVRKAIAKKCSYLPIIGRLLIKELNKEFGEKALPNG